MDAPSARTAVLGLGNPVLTDDAVGLRVAERLRALLDADPVPGADVLASTRAGFELIDMLQGYARAIIVDALELPDPRPGRVRSLDLGSFAGSARLNSAHEIDVATAFELARTLGIPMPGSVEIFAVEAKATRFMLTHPDYLEGIRARLIDKDDRPRWQPPAVDEVPPIDLELE